MRLTSSWQTLDLGSVTVEQGQAPVIIAGLCVLEDLDQALALAERLRDICNRRSLPYVFKASFDKANRTSLDSYRGPGLDSGLDILAKVRERIGVPVLTDVHVPQQAQVVGQVVDVLQVPAFLCRQTDLLLACGRTHKPVNIKKGQFMVPSDMKYAAQKVRSAGGLPLVTERGSSFGHGDLVVDMRSLVWMRQAGCPVVFDGTHSVQQPGAGGFTGGLRDMITPLVRAALAVGVDGLYLEVHGDPDAALCDGPNCLGVEQFDSLMAQVQRLWAV